MSAIAQRLAQDYPNTNAGWTVWLTPLREQSVGRVRLLLFVLFGAVVFVLLMACANVANLLLARAISRRTEIAIRSSLGASRFRVIRQLLAENLLLAVIGGTLGLLLAHWGVRLLIAAGPDNIPRLNEARVDGPVLVFTVVVSLLAGVLSGLVPALHTSQVNLGESLKGSTSGRATARGDRLRDLLVISEVALAVILLVGAGLMIRSFWRLQATDPGFNSQSVVAMDVVLPKAKYQSRTSRRPSSRKRLRE